MSLQVLLVEDDPDDAFFATDALATDPRNDFHVSRVKSMGEALAVLALHPADVVLCDLGLPDSDGLDTAHQLLEAAGSAPVVVLTGCKDESVGAAAVQAGAQDYVVKGTADLQRLGRTLLFAVERKRMLDTLQHAALHDELTGLPKRALLEDRIARSLAGARRFGEGFAVAFVDLDRFKPLNDHYGHRVGDQVLISVARRMCGVARAVDTIARLGGDEFGCLLTRVTSRRDAAQIGRRIHRAIIAPHRVVGPDGHPVSVTLGASVGVALYPIDGDSHFALLGAADSLMYAAKENGGGVALRGVIEISGDAAANTVAGEGVEEASGS